MTLVVLLVLVILIAVALRLSVPMLDKGSVAKGIEPVNGNSFLSDCPNTPNCQSSEASRQGQKVDRFLLSEQAQTSNVLLTLTKIIEQHGGTVVTQKGYYLHATFTSRLMRFTDDVEFLVSDDEMSVQIRSASRIGKSDLGANAKRLNQLRAAFESFESGSLVRQ